MNRLSTIAVTACLSFCGACTADSPKTLEAPSKALVDAPSAEEAPDHGARDKRIAFMDFNRNGIDDAIDISNFDSLDEDNNGIPDEAE